MLALNSLALPASASQVLELKTHTIMPQALDFNYYEIIQI